MSIGPVSTPTRVDTLGRRRKGSCPTPILTGDEYYRIPLSKGQFALVDPEDYLEHGKYHWQAAFSKKTNSYYAVRIFMTSRKRTYISLHREVMGAKSSDELVVDHINHNTLDNRRSNLRKCSLQQNSFNCKLSKANTNGFKGIRQITGGKWEARITINRKTISLGYFERKEDAVSAREKGAHQIFGEFACKGAA